MAWMVSACRAEGASLVCNVGLKLFWMWFFRKNLEFVYSSPNCIGIVSIKQIQLFRVNLTSIKVKKIPEYLWSVSHYFTILPALRYTLTLKKALTCLYDLSPLSYLLGFLCFAAEYAFDSKMLPETYLVVVWCKAVLCPEPWCLFLELHLHVLLLCRDHTWDLRLFLENWPRATGGHFVPSHWQELKAHLRI